MIFNSPDDALRMWWKLKVQTETTACAEQSIARCRVCSNCSGHEHALFKNKKGEEFDICVRCKAAWNPQWEYALYVYGQESIRRNQTFSQFMRVKKTPGFGDGGEFELVEFADLDAIISELQSPNAEVYGLSVLYGHTRSQIPKLMLEGFPASGVWTDKRIRRAIGSCRRKIEEALESRGLWVSAINMSI